MADGERVVSPGLVGETETQLNGNAVHAAASSDERLDPGMAFLRTSRQAILSCVGATSEEMQAYEDVAYVRDSGLGTEGPSYD